VKAADAPQQHRENAQGHSGGGDARFDSSVLQGPQTLEEVKSSVGVGTQAREDGYRPFFCRSIFCQCIREICWSRSRIFRS